MAAKKRRGGSYGKIKNNKTISKILPFTHILYLKQQNSILKCFSRLKFEKSLFRNTFFSFIFGHVHKYEVTLWTLKNCEKYLFCYKMIIFNVAVLKISENMYIIDI